MPSRSRSRSRSRSPTRIQGGDVLEDVVRIGNKDLVRRRSYYEVPLSCANGRCQAMQAYMESLSPTDEEDSEEDWDGYSHRDMGETEDMSFSFFKKSSKASKPSKATATINAGGAYQQVLDLSKSRTSLAKEQKRLKALNKHMKKQQTHLARANKYVEKSRKLYGKSESDKKGYATLSKPLYTTEEWASRPAYFS